MSDTQMTAPEPQVRPAKLAIRRGLALRCPACGEGKLFSSYLKVVKTCPHCGEDLSHQRADDGPAYLTILIVAHIAGFLMHGLFSWTDLTPVMIAAVVIAAVIPASLLILPSAKGFMVAIQWANYMHGFGRRRDPDA